MHTVLTISRNIR